MSFATPRNPRAARSLVRSLTSATAVAAAVLAAAGCSSASSGSSGASPAAAAPTAPLAATAVAGTCPTPAGAARARAALIGAEARYHLEERGRTIHADLQQIAHDSAFTSALTAGDLHGALEAANRELVRHVVRIRVIRGSHVLVDANPTSFDVGGSSLELFSGGGRDLGRLVITVQDVIGFNKLVHKLQHADVIVRGAGDARTTLSSVPKGRLPTSGCARIGGRTYVLGSFVRKGFTGEPLRIWVLTAPS